LVTKAKNKRNLRDGRRQLAMDLPQTSPSPWEAPLSGSHDLKTGGIASRHLDRFALYLGSVRNKPSIGINQPSLNLHSRGKICGCQPDHIFTDV